MWYFLWVLGTLLACFLGVFAALILEKREAKKLNEKENTSTKKNKINNK